MAGVAKFLAFDLGAESGRALLAKLDNGKLELEEIHRFSNTPVRVFNSIHWDVLRLFDDIKHGLRRAVQQHGGDIAGIGVDTWGVDYGFFGESDILLSNPYHYRDSRTDGMMDEVFYRVPKEEIWAKTGIQFMQLNTLYQLYSASRRTPWLLENARTMLMMGDIFNFWLTGRKVCEFSNATTSQCYNPIEDSWAYDLLEKLDIPTHFLPEIVKPGTVLGSVLDSVREETGAPAIPVIAPATHDTGCAVAAVPATGKGHAYISSGTWSLMGVEITEPLLNEQAFAMNFTNEGGVYGTFRFLRNIMGLWIIQECRRQWQRQGLEYTYNEIAEMAGEAKPWQSLVDPDNKLFLPPGDMPSRIQKYCAETGQHVPETPGEIARAGMDSLALKYRMVVENLDKFFGIKHEPIHIVGGGTQNKLLCQLTANATKRTVVAGPVEATAIGNVLVQAISTGHVADLNEARSIIRNSFDLVSYEPQSDSEADDAYGRFLNYLGINIENSF